MKNIKLSVLAGVLLASSAAFGGIVGSPHDLSGVTYTDSNATLGDNGEICVYCHTPHGASKTMDGAPLWNKQDVNGSTFTLYGATLGSVDNATDATVNNQSLACLSCHDGVSSIDSIVNAPGSGFNTIAGTTAIQDNPAGYSGIANLTQDLTNTHPISIKYVPTTNASLKITSSSLSNWSGAATISDLLRGVDGDRVECGSCHDPHNGYGTLAADIYGTGKTTRATEVNFLRHSNAGSALCLGCHDK